MNNDRGLGMAGLLMATNLQNRGFRRGKMERWVLGEWNQEVLDSSLVGRGMGFPAKPFAYCLSSLVWPRDSWNSFWFGNWAPHTIRGERSRLPVKGPHTNLHISHSDWPNIVWNVHSYAVSPKQQRHAHRTDGPGFLCLSSYPFQSDLSP